ncbi:MFS transporter [Actinacidiphila acididurans]|uniref:MFS transporter n=1 Tax=Actinacidiphila acididurans TaxID=2784346 RepID=A0ABS2TYE2_9ACTN|nr:MFS transporter [Actinacidiphila acididurans]MBM9508006.1 MFS transporter [Actinacidiphila acididurans]
MLPTLARCLRSGGTAQLYFMRSTDALASTTATYAIPLLVLVTTGSTALTGIAFVLEWTPRLAAFTFAGALVDRWGAGAVFRCANVIRATVVALAGAVLMFLPQAGTAATCVVLAFGATSGLLAQISFVAVETLGSEAGRRLGNQAYRVQAVQTGIDQGAILVGPLLGGLLLLAGPGLLPAVVAALAMTAASYVPDEANPMAHQPVPSSLLTGWRTLRRTPALVWLVAGLAASNLATGVLQAAAPIMVIHHIRRSTASVGVVWTMAAVGSLLAVWATRRAMDRWQVWPVGAFAAAVATVACGATALAPGFGFYIASVAAVMAAEGAMTVVLRTLRSRLIPPAAFGSTLAVTIILVLVPLPVAGVLIASVPAAAISHLLLACAALQGLVLATCFAGLRRHRSSYTDVATPVLVQHRRSDLQSADQP